VVDKTTKLETIFDRIELVRLRVELLRKEREIAGLRAGQIPASGPGREAGEDGPDLDRIFQFIRRANIGGEFMRDEDLAEIARIASLRFELDGESTPLLNENEVECCSIRKGTLTEKERQIINHHVAVGIRMLESLPFLKKWARVPEYAGMHHEKLDGSGYPRGKRGEEISLPARILAVADVFEALTASDRPYTVGRNLSEALQIMELMVKESHLDGAICDFLVESGIVSQYVEEFLADKQQGHYCWKSKKYQDFLPV
jgi:hypothetical protein